MKDLSNEMLKISIQEVLIKEQLNEKLKRFEGNEITDVFIEIIAKDIAEIFINFL